MRQYALIGLILLLPGCSGVYTFLSDTHSFTWNPNRPIGDSENIRRVRGLAPNLPPVTPEPGNVWPGPVPPEPTLSDLEKDTTPLGTQPGMPPAPDGSTNPSQTTPAAPDHRQPRPITRGSSTPPGNTQPGLTLAPPGTGAPPVPAAPPSSASGPGPVGRVYQTPQGPAVGTQTQGHTDTLSGPGRNGAIVVPNGNGTSTIINPDGSITTVPTPK
jgi:hypothetical protein